MAALAALPMRYRNFVATTEEPRISEQLTSAIVTSEQSNAPERALAFPLLMAALPEINQAALPKVPVVQNSPPPKSQMPVQQPPNVASNTAAASIRLKPKAPLRVLQPRYELARGGSRKPALKQQMTGSTSDGGAAPNLAAVFQGLQPAASSHGEPIEVKSDLQKMFSRL